MLIISLIISILPYRINIIPRIMQQILINNFSPLFRLLGLTKMPGSANQKKSPIMIFIIAVNISYNCLKRGIEFIQNNTPFSKSLSYFSIAIHFIDFTLYCFIFTSQCLFAICAITVVASDYVFSLLFY